MSASTTCISFFVRVSYRETAYILERNVHDESVCLFSSGEISSRERIGELVWIAVPLNVHFFKTILRTVLLTPKQIA